MDRSTARALAEKLVAQMTIEEKASQLRYDAPAIERLGIPAYNWWNEALHGVARAGTATVFPQAIGLAAIFDEDLMEEIADVMMYLNDVLLCYDIAPEEISRAYYKKHLYNLRRNYRQQNEDRYGK